MVTRAKRASEVNFSTSKSAAKLHKPNYNHTDERTATAIDA